MAKEVSFSVKGPIDAKVQAELDRMAREVTRLPWRGARRRLPETLPKIFFCGDPHGQFDHIKEAVLKHKPDAVVLLGDMELERPIEDYLGRAYDPNLYYWIPGNHDTDSEDYYDYLWSGSMREHNLHGRVLDVKGLKIAGLGGVFRGRIWMPGMPPLYRSQAEFYERICESHRWREGIPRRHRSTIFPSEYEGLMRHKADILVTHEASGRHPNGFQILDRLAKRMRTCWYFHGHQHEDWAYGMVNGVHTRGVGFRGVVDLQGNEIVPSQPDPKYLNAEDDES